MAADANLPDVLEVDLVVGRWLDEFDENDVSRAAVIGLGLAREIEYLPGESRTLQLEGHSYGIVGVLGEVELDPTLDSRGLHPFSGAEEDFVGDDILPSTLFIRSEPGTEEETAAALRTAISLGGSKEVATEIKSKRSNSRPRATVSSSSSSWRWACSRSSSGHRYCERHVDLGDPTIDRDRYRRALGHARRIIAGQFTLESMAVGLMGASWASRSVSLPSQSASGSPGGCSRSSSGCHSRASCSRSWCRWWASTRGSPRASNRSKPCDLAKPTNSRRR